MYSASVILNESENINIRFPSRNKHYYISFGRDSESLYYSVLFTTID